MFYDTSFGKSTDANEIFPTSNALFDMNDCAFSVCDSKWNKSIQRYFALTISNAERVHTKSPVAIDIDYYLLRVHI